MNKEINDSDFEKMLKGWFMYFNDESIRCGDHYVRFSDRRDKGKSEAYHDIASTILKKAEFYGINIDE